MVDNKSVVENLVSLFVEKQKSFFKCIVELRERKN